MRTLALRPAQPHCPQTKTGAGVSDVPQSSKVRAPQGGHLRPLYLRSSSVKCVFCILCSCALPCAAAAAAASLPAVLPAPQMGPRSSHTHAACGSSRWRWPSLNTKDSACSTPGRWGRGRHQGRTRQWGSPGASVGHQRLVQVARQQSRSLSPIASAGHQAA